MTSGIGRKILLPDLASMQCRQRSLKGHHGEVALRRQVKGRCECRRRANIVGEVRQFRRPC